MTFQFCFEQMTDKFSLFFKKMEKRMQYGGLNIMWEPEKNNSYKRSENMW